MARTRPGPASAEPDETPADDAPQEPSTRPEPADEPAEQDPTEPSTEPGPADAPDEPDADPADEDLDDEDSDDEDFDDEDPDDDLTGLDDALPWPATNPTPWPALLGAEAFGTFVLVLAGVGTALYAIPNLTGAGLSGGPLAVALASGLALTAGVAAFWNVSGAHFNPAVTLGAALAGRLDWVRVLPYWAAQVFGGVMAALMLFVTVPTTLPEAIGGDPESTVRQYFSSAANGFDRSVDLATLSGANSPLGRASGGQVTVSLLTALIIEAVATAALVGVVLATTRRRANLAAAPLAVGGVFALGLMVTMPLTNGSLNPARSLATALFSETWALGQLWVFWVGPLFGAVVAGLAARLFAPPELDDLGTPAEVE